MLRNALLSYRRVANTHHTHGEMTMAALRFTFSPEPVEAATYRNRSGQLMAAWATGDGRTFVYRLRPDGTFGRGDTNVCGTYTDEPVSPLTHHTH